MKYFNKIRPISFKNIRGAEPKTMSKLIEDSKQMHADKLSAIFAPLTEQDVENSKKLRDEQLSKVLGN